MIAVKNEGLTCFLPFLDVLRSDAKSAVRIGEPVTCLRRCRVSGIIRAKLKAPRAKIPKPRRSGSQRLRAMRREAREGASMPPNRAALTPMRKTVARWDSSITSAAMAKIMSWERTQIGQVA